MGSLVIFTFLHVCESWTLRVELQRRIEAMEMRCYRKVLRISYKDHVTNEEVRAMIQQAIGPHEDFLTIVKRRKLQWYGHVSRSSDLAKTILQGTVKGGRRQGRERKKWEDSIRKWTGLEFGKSQRAVKNKEKWRKLIAKSSVVPQRHDDDDDVMMMVVVAVMMMIMMIMMVMMALLACTKGHNFRRYTKGGRAGSGYNVINCVGDDRR